MAIDTKAAHTPGPPIVFHGSVKRDVMLQAKALRGRGEDVYVRKNGDGWAVYDKGAYNARAAISRAEGR